MITKANVDKAIKRILIDKDNVIREFDSTRRRTSRDINIDSVLILLVERELKKGV